MMTLSAMNAPTPVQILCLARMAPSRMKRLWLGELACSFGSTGRCGRSGVGLGAGAVSSIHSCHPGGGAGHSGEGPQPGAGTQPGGGAGQFGGGLNRYPIPSHSLPLRPRTAPHHPAHRPWHLVIMQQQRAAPQRLPNIDRPPMTAAPRIVRFPGSRPRDLASGRRGSPRPPAAGRRAGPRPPAAPHPHPRTLVTGSFPQVTGVTISALRSREPVD